MKKNLEYERFDDAIKTILSADPKAVRSAMDRESKEQAREREAKGEMKRGRKKQERK